MAIVNALLCRWSGGFHEVIRPSSIAAHGRREAFLSLGNAPSTAEVERIAAAQLNRLAAPQESVSAGIEASGPGDTPYVSFAVGDTIQVPDSAGTSRSRRVTGITVTEDQEGNPFYTPELRGPA